MDIHVFLHVSSINERNSQPPSGSLFQEESSSPYLFVRHPLDEVRHPIFEVLWVFGPESEPVPEDIHGAFDGPAAGAKELQVEGVGVGRHVGGRLGVDGRTEFCIGEHG